jgi:hypothetical protein
MQGLQSDECRIPVYGHQLGTLSEGSFNKRALASSHEEITTKPASHKLSQHIKRKYEYRKQIMGSQDYHSSVIFI